MNVIRDNNRSFDSRIPVAIVGAGACGLSAALSAKQAGADVLVLERDQNPSGSTAMSYGAICAAGTRLQRSAGLRDDADLMFEDILTATRSETDRRLARTIADQCGPTVDWLSDDIAIELTVELSWTGLGHRHPRLHAPANRSGKTLMAMLLERVADNDIDVLTRATVNAVVADDNDRVTGVQVQRPDGEQETLGCNALILASCGFGANREMVSTHIPALANAVYHGHEGNDGAGILWGQRLGGAVADMGSYQALGSLAMPQRLALPHTLMIGGGIQVNARGERFENELEDISGQALTILEQPGSICWIVYDDRCHRHALERFEEYRDAAEVNTAKSAETIADLAAVTGIARAGLEKTIEAVKTLAATDAEDRFGRRFKANETLRPPYYAAQVTGALFHTQGGLCVDEHARVVRSDGSPLPNLYAGGGTARSVSGPSGWGYLPGMGLCTAVTLGRLAGTSSANYVANSV